MRQASRVVRNIDGTGVDEYALLLGDHLQRDDDACRRWAQHLNAQSSHWTG